jgi:hypothetical protein
MRVASAKLNNSSGTPWPVHQTILFELGSVLCESTAAAEGIALLQKAAINQETVSGGGGRHDLDQSQPSELGLGGTNDLSSRQSPH